MSVSFTGIKNVGSMATVVPQAGQQMYIMSLQVTNDENGNDLDEFKKALSKTKNSEKYMTQYDEGLISINLGKEVSEDEFVPDKNTFYLNASPLEVNDDNLPMYTYLAKLTKNIANKKNNQLPIESEYFGTKDFLNGTSIGYFVKKVFEVNPNINIGAMIKTIHNPENVKVGANIINDSIQDTMVDYIG